MNQPMVGVSLGCFRPCISPLLSVQNPWGVRTCLRSWQLIQLNQAEDGRWCDSEDIGNFTDRHFTTSLSFSLTTDWNTVMIAYRTDTDWRPDLSVCRAALILIQDRGYPCVGLGFRCGPNLPAARRAL
jgi:hypothetical protein